MPLSPHKFFVAIGSRKQGICIWLAFAVVLILTFFPPWVKRYEIMPAQRIKLWHAPYSHNPAKLNRWVSYEIDYPRMLTEITVGECFVLALYLSWAGRD